MLDDLMNLEIAVNTLQEDQQYMSEHAEMDPIDIHFSSLKITLEALEPTSSEYCRIVESIASTHAPTHTDYRLRVRTIFRLERSTEIETFRQQCQQYPQQATHRQLLWHGSRITNFIGILRQGLRIAPVSSRLLLLNMDRIDGIACTRISDQN
jgi:poly [ADP-ribose] polymerase